MKKIIKCRLIIIFAVVVALSLSLIIYNYSLTVTKYSFETNAEIAIRIVFISDLHGRNFGKSNSALIEKIKNQAPDMICLGGDFIDEDNNENDNAEFAELCLELIKIAPVYYCYGNHDLNYIVSNSDEIIDQIADTGCIILDKNYTDINVNGTIIRLGGLFDYAFNQKYIDSELWQASDSYRFLSDFSDTENTTVLLSHRPESFIYEDASSWNIDYVLCGHTHGGLWQLPFVGGFIAPEQGFFPEYDKGEFDIGNIKMIISSGLSGYKNIPRLFNCPEITVIEFV